MQLLRAEHHRLVRRINAATALNQSRQPPASFSMDNFQVVALVAAFLYPMPHYELAQTLEPNQMSGPE
jgi:hypothetical protein